MITAAMVKELRVRTGVGMMDCKKALAEANGDMDKAVDILREKGLSKAAKKAGRIAVEGRVEKYFAEVCLLEQPFIKDGDKVISEVILEAIAKMGEKISIRRFVRYQLGEGIEKKQENFADEVMNQINN